MPTPVTLSPSDLQLPSFYRWERERADKIFLTQPLGRGGLRDITWAQAGDEARRIATWLTAQGWPAGSNVAILGKNSAHWILADLAIWMAGHVSVPIYPTFNAQALRFILDHSEARACFVGKLDDTDSLGDGVPGGVPLIALPLSPKGVAKTSWDALIAANAPQKGETVRDGETLCTIIYTSGTTGNPKGVMHKFNAMAWGLQSANRRIAMGSDDHFLSYLPLAHVAERMIIEQGALKNGSHIFFAESLETFVLDLQRARPTIFFSVPRLWVKFQQGVHAKMPAEKLARLLKLPIIRGIVAKKIRTALGLNQCTIAAGGAAPMPPELLRWYERLGLPIIEVYGMTENCGVSHATLPGVQRPGTVGQAYDGVQSRLDPQTGEIQMKSPGLMLGYYKEPVLTAEALTADGWLRTGDKGQPDAEGNLRITGRVKDLFKTSKGKYVAPAPIEDKLVMNGAVEACIVTGANLGQPLGIVMLNAEAAKRAEEPAQRQAMEVSLSAHLDAVNARLDPHEQLDCLVVVSEPWTVDNGFITPTFKVRRNRIEEVYGAQFERWTGKHQRVVWHQG